MQSVSITTNVVSSNPLHGEVCSIQHYVIKFVSNLQQYGGFRLVLQFLPPIKLIATILYIYYIAEILWKVALNIITLTLFPVYLRDDRTYVLWQGGCKALIFTLCSVGIGFTSFGSGFVTDLDSGGFEMRADTLDFVASITVASGVISNGIADPEFFSGNFKWFPLVAGNEKRSITYTGRLLFQINPSQIPTVKTTVINITNNSIICFSIKSFFCFFVL